MRINICSIELVRERAVNYTSVSRIRSVDDVYKVCTDVLCAHKKSSEQCWVIYLDLKLKITAIHTIGKGGISECIVDSVEVFKGAFLSNSTAFILVHNHPSGETTPSIEDLQITKKLLIKSKVLGLELLDHLIIGEDSFCSLRQMNESIFSLEGINLADCLQFV